MWRLNLSFLPSPKYKPLDSVHTSPNRTRLTIDFLIFGFSPNDSQESSESRKFKREPTHTKICFYYGNTIDSAAP